MSDKIPLLAICGPTASGKTGLAVRLSKRMNGEIVSCDSMQVYSGMEIATAQPCNEQKGDIPHHLIGVVSPSDSFSVGEFLKLAKDIIKDIYSRNRLPVVCGGTGLYLSSLLDNVSLPPAADRETRENLMKQFDILGEKNMLDRLAAIDPETACQLHPNDRERIIRALEVYEKTGITMSSWRERSKQHDSEYKACIIGITYKERQLLYEKINSRVDSMLENGLLEEAKHYYDSELKNTAAQAIGHKELFDYFKGTITLEEAVENIKRSTRRYAKRQLTWFRRDKRINWIYRDTMDDDELENTAYRIAVDTLS